MAFTTEFVMGAGGASFTRVPVNVTFPNYDWRNLTTVTLTKRSLLAGHVEATGALIVGPIVGPQALYSTDANTFAAALNAGTYTISASPADTTGVTATVVNWVAIPL